MKKKMFLPCVVSVSLIILFVLPANALFDNDVKKAKEFMTAGMYPQAIELLNKRINEKPTDAEAHFQLGVCYVNTGNYSGADQRFGSAVKLKPDYGYQIGGKYKKVGDEALNKGNTGQAQSLFEKAVEYQPDLKAGIAKECFSAGEKYLNQHQSSTADGLLSMAVKYDPSLRQDMERICRAYGEKLLALAKEKPKNERERYVNEAKKYLNQKDIDAVFPPPSWKTVYQKEFVGVGYTGGDDPDNDGAMYTIENGKNCQKGDKITVLGKNTEVWHFGAWQKVTNGSFTLINQISKNGARLSVRAPKGEHYSIIVERFM